MHPRTALITGVSTGIGHATARALLSKGYIVFGSVRAPEMAHSLQQDFGAQFIPLVFDVTDPSALATAVRAVETRLQGEGLGCLINNAGIAIGGPFQHQPFTEIRQHLEVNVLGLMAVTQAFLPLLGARAEHPTAPGKILNISSLSGKIAFPFFAAYVASKHAVEGFSHSLRRELLAYGIDVIIIGPGSVQTPIWEKGNQLHAYLNTGYADRLGRFSKIAMRAGKHGIPVEAFGIRIAGIVDTPRPKTRYAIVKGYIKNYLLVRLLPDRMLDWVVKKMLD